MINLAENIRYLTRKNGMNQEALAKLVDKSRSTAGAYIRGDASPPAEILVIIAKHFGVSLDELVLGDLYLEKRYPILRGKPGELAEGVVPYESAVKKDVEALRIQMEMMREQLESVRSHMQTQNDLIRELKKDKK